MEKTWKYSSIRKNMTIDCIQGKKNVEKEEGIGKER